MAIHVLPIGMLADITFKAFMAITIKIKYITLLLQKKLNVSHR